MGDRYYKVIRTNYMKAKASTLTGWGLLIGFVPKHCLPAARRNRKYEKIQALLACVDMAQHREPFISLALYHLFKWSVVSPVLHVYLRGRIYGAKKVPMDGPLIVVANHASNFDPPLLSNCMRRPVSFMAKESLFKVPVFSSGIRAYGAYPVKRGSADRSAIRAALTQLENGWAVGIFLQGVRTPDGRIPSPKLGAALIAAKAQVPLLPVCLWGTERILSKGSAVPKPAAVTVRIGEPIAPPVDKDKEALKAITQRCVDEIHALHDLGR